MKAALITLGIDLSETDRLSHSLFKLYANRHELDFHVIDEFQFRIQPNLFKKRRVTYHIEKFQLFDYFETYDRILYLDSDILIHPSCPNLLEWVSEEFLGVVYDDWNHESWKRLEELEKLENKCGPLPIDEKRHFNAGMMVLSKHHQALFELKRDEIVRGRWPEQTLLNYRVLRDGISIQELPVAFNFNPRVSADWDLQEKRLEAKLIHYAGPSAKDKMAADFECLNVLW